MSIGDPQLLDEVEAQVKAWLDVAATQPVDASAKRLAQVLKDPHGLAFTLGFVDRVVRPEDPEVAAAALRELVAITPRFLPWYQKVALRLGARLSVSAPWLVIPVARRVLRRMVGHLLIDATDSRLGAQIERIKRRGVKLNINLLGEAVLGEAEAHRRLEGTRRLLARADVDYVSLKVSSAVPPHSPWGYDEALEHIVEQLLPLYRYAATQPTPKFINLDMEEYHDLDLTLDVFTRLLDLPELLNLSAGVVLQAYLPDALGAMVRLQEWSAARRARGGAPIKVRLVKGANLPMERVQSSLFGWPLATWGSKQETDTSYKKVLDYAFTSSRIANVRVGVAGHNLFDIAFAWVLAGRRGVRDGIDFEMLLGMAEGQASAVHETVGGLLLYVPVVHPADFDVAIAYLVRRLEEGASQENFMSAVFDIHDSSSLYQRERDRFVASLAAMDGEVPAPHRVPREVSPSGHFSRASRHFSRASRQFSRSSRQFSRGGGFVNTPDTDPAVAANRAWGREILERVPSSRLGDDLVAKHSVTDVAAVEAVLAETAAASWSGSRASVLRAAAVEFERRRAEFLEVAASECGKTLDQSDPEVSEAIDFLNYYADLAEELSSVDGARAVPVKLTLVVPPWNFPIAIPTGGVAAALAAGSSVVIKPAPQAARCGSLLVEALWAAGVPQDVLRLVHVPENEVGRALVSSPLVDRLILTGAFETASLFRSFRPDLQLLAETSGKNSIIITPTADLDLAVKDLVVSAFGHAGQKCSAASLGILVGSVASSSRFRTQLIDAVTSLKVGWPSDPTTQMGPIIEPASGKLLKALTTLGPGESWLVKPRQLEDRLWTPGVKTGVRRGSEFHLTEYFGPVLGLMTARDLDEAITIQNETAYGLTAGLHSLERSEVETWIDRVEAGNAYVNRTTVGAIVRRQPFGGWKRSAVGAGAKAGGPNYLIGLTDWAPAPAPLPAEPSVLTPEPSVLTPEPSVLTPEPSVLTPEPSVALRELLTEFESDFLRRSVASDAAWWASEFGVAKDVSGLMAEKNVFRYLPVPVTVRVEADEPEQVVRVAAAGMRAGSAVTVSLGVPLDPAVWHALSQAGARVIEEDDAMWPARLQGDDAPHRVRLIGGSRAGFAKASRGRVDIALYAQPVVESGRIELLTFLREQAVAVTAHRFGSPTSLAEGLFKPRVSN